MMQQHNQLKDEAHAKLATVSEDKAFRLQDGSTLYSLHDLKNAARTMGTSVFSHHVSGHRSDFANWIAGVFHDEELAEHVRAAHTPKELYNKIASHIAVLEHYNTRKVHIPSRAHHHLPPGVFDFILGLVVGVLVGIIVGAIVR